MKAGWEVKALGDVAKFHYGKALPKPERDPDGAFPVLGANGPLARSDNYLVEGPVLIVGRKGSVGEVTRVDGKCWPTDVTFFTEHDQAKLDFDFFEYSLSMLNLPSLAKGVKPGLNRNEAYTLQIPLPPLEEQKQIVAVLDAAFAGLTRARTHIETNLQNARELFRRSIESSFEALAHQGELKTVDDIAQIKGGKRLPKGELLSSEKTPFPYISIKDFNEQGSVDVQRIKYLSASARAAIKNYIIHAEDLYISIAGTIGKTGIVPAELDGANLTENAARMIFVDGVSNEYVYYFTLTDDFQEQAGLNTRTAAQPKLALKRLKTISIPMVSSAEQVKLVNVLKEISEQTEIAEANYRQKLQDLEDLRQSLLQKAFAGELT